jgi:diguanylate cyclase (GGDEF)-like protein
MSKFATLNPALELSDIICHIGDSIVVADKDMNLLAVTETFARSYGVTSAELLGKNAHDIYPDFKNSVFFACIQYTYRTQQTHSIVGFSNKMQGHFIVKTVPYHGNYIVHIQPLTGTIAQSGYTNNHDSLTSLPNRGAFDEDLEQLLHHRTALGLIIVDVNRFRAFNETFGFEQGNRLLMELAARLKCSLFHKIYRIGPNQFAVAVLSHRADTLQICNALLSQFEAPFRIKNKDYHVTASAGFKYIDDFSVTASEHVSNVDEALRQAKRLKSGYVEYQPHASTSNGFSVVTEFKTALSEHELVPYYQPQIDTITKQVCGAEALVRWKHSSRGLVSPVEFLPVVHDYGLNIELDYYMVETVFEDMAGWTGSGLADLNVSINLSSSAICRMETVGFIKECLERYKLQAEFVTFEITENAVMENVELSRGVIQQLSDMGFKIAIDDFGTGYSSMGYLLKYPTDILKIDKEFINGVSESRTLQHVAGSMIRLGKSLNMLVVAEGVETAMDAAFLKKHHCDILQGYYYSKPLVRADFEAFAERIGVSNCKSLLI